MADSDGAPSGLIIRIDNRFLHGQIIYGWVAKWPASAIYIVDDNVWDNMKEREIYNQLINSCCRGEVLPVRDVKSELLKKNLEGNTMVLVKDCQNALRVIDAGVVPEEICLCSVPLEFENTPERINQLLGSTDFQALSDLSRRNIPVVLRYLPNSSAKKLLLVQA